MRVSPWLEDEAAGQIDELTRATGLGMSHVPPMATLDAALLLLAEHLGDDPSRCADARDVRTDRWKNRKPFHSLFA
jgi:hypothetical protein